MGPLRDGNQVLGIEDVVLRVDDIVGSHRVHVVDGESGENLEAYDTEITGIISNDDVSSDVSPGSALVEVLVEVSVESSGE